MEKGVFILSAFTVAVTWSSLILLPTNLISVSDELAPRPRKSHTHPGLPTIQFERLRYISVLCFFKKSVVPIAVAPSTPILLNTKPIPVSKVFQPILWFSANYTASNLTLAATSMNCAKKSLAARERKTFANTLQRNISRRFRLRVCVIISKDQTFQ